MRWSSCEVSSVLAGCSHHNSRCTPPPLAGDKFGDYVLETADNFTYTDPIDGRCATPLPCRLAAAIAPWLCTIKWGARGALQLCLPAAARPLCTSASTQTMPCLPLPRSVAKNQGIRFVFQDGSRIIFRLRCAPHGTAESCPSALLPWVLESRA